MAYSSCDRKLARAAGGLLVAAPLLVLAASAAVSVPLPERNPVREAELPLPERNPIRAAELPLPARNPLRVVPEPSPEAKQERGGYWPKLLPGAPEILMTWSVEEINSERARCAEILKDADAETEPADPLRNGGCGAPGPVKLISIGRATKVSVMPPATMTCDLVVALAHWMEKHVQPAARRLLGKPVTRISNISDYSCRNALARTTMRLSEHALANALDIRDFITEDGEVIDLKRDWGPTARDIAAQIAAEKAAEAARKAAEAAARAAKEAAAKVASERSASKDKGEAKAEATPDPKAETKTEPKADPKPASKIEPKAEATAEKAAEAAEPQSARQLRRLRRGERQKTRQEAREAAREAALAARDKPPALIPTSAALAAAAETPGPRGQFLREVHQAACGLFGTVLGPEANEAHRDHFHLDMAKRRYGSFCE